MKYLKAAGSVLAISASLGGAASAQSPGADDVIVVTAQKREQTIGEVPISVALIGEERLDEQGLDDFDGVARYVPNFNFNEAYTARTVSVNIRGLASTTENVGIDPSVGFFVDGVFLARPIAATGKLNDVSSIEVLRGPQGTLYGRNTSVGAVNIITRDPGDEIEARLDVGLGNFDLVDVSGRIAVPLTDMIGLSVSGFYEKSDSFIDETSTGEPNGRNEYYGIRAKLVAEPTDTFRVALIGDFAEFDITGNKLLPVIQNGVPQDTFAYEVGSNGVAFSNVKTNGVSGQFDWDLGPATLTSISAYRWGEDSDISEFEQEFDLGRIGQRNEDNQFSQEVRIASNEPIFDFDYILGFYYFKNELDQTDLINYPVFGGLRYNGVYNSETDAWALFGQISYNVSDRLKLTYGFRYNDEKKEAVFGQTPDAFLALEVPPFVGVDFPTIPTSSIEADDTDYLNMASLNYQLSDNSNIYATYAEGYKSGGINAQLISTPANLFVPTELIFSPEDSKNYEIGYRGSVGGVRFNLAAFYMEFQNLQVSTTIESNGVLVAGIDNAAEAEIYGFEGDVTWSPVEGLDLYGSLAYNKSEYKDTVLRLDPTETRDLSGQTLAFAPKVSAAFGAQYEHAISNNLVATLRGDVSYTGEQVLDALLDPRAQIDSYTVVDASLSVGSEDGRWRLMFWGKNLFEEEYLTFALNNPAVGFEGNLPFPFDTPEFLGTAGAPRTWGARITVEY